MVMTDPIADMLSRLRNTVALGRAQVEIPHSKLKQSIAEVLKQEGYVSSVSTKDASLVLELAKRDNQPKLEHLQRISKPGRRWYRSAAELPRVRQGLGIAVVSTSRGVMTADQARRKKLGGEVLLEAY